MGKGDNRRPRQITEEEWNNRWEMAYGKSPEEDHGVGGQSGEAPSDLPGKRQGCGTAGQDPPTDPGRHRASNACHGRLHTPGYRESRDNRTQRLLRGTLPEPDDEGPGESVCCPDAAGCGNDQPLPAA